MNLLRGVFEQFVGKMHPYGQGQLLCHSSGVSSITSVKFAHAAASDPFPWECSDLDSFQLTSKGDELPMYSVLTKDV